MNIGDQLFDFQLEDFNGNLRSPKEMYRQFTLLVIFFSSDCKICRAYLKRIEKLALRYENDDLAIFLVDIEPKPGFEPEKEFVELKLMPNPNFLHLKDATGEMARKFDAKATPEAFLFDRDRKLAYRGMIDDNWEHPDFVTRVYVEDAIEYTLDGMEYDFPETIPVGTPIQYQ